MSPLGALAHAAIAIAIATLVALGAEKARLVRLLPALVGVVAAACALELVVLLVNHVPFPFHLDLMEGVVMQHARRAAASESIYPLPTPRFVPLAYNALFYILAAPFLRIFGDTMPVLRMVSVLGMLGSIAA
ncbi:MAG: hypothetical protein ABI884_14230, partial [Gemmatimonadota bacterium]